MIPKKCIIDNWSLEHASVLVDGDSSLRLRREKAPYYFGALSNFVVATLLYETPYYIKNGFEDGWMSRDWFKKNAMVYIKGTSLKELHIPWKSKTSYKDKGVANYLLTSRYFESDLLVSPIRATEITGKELNKLNGPFIEALNLADKLIKEEAERLAFERTQVRIKNNLLLPGLTQYVLRESSNRDDILKVIMQLRADGKMQRIISKIEEMVGSTKGASKLQREVEKLVRKAYGKAHDSGSTSITLSALFLSVGRDIDLDFFRRSEYFVFLRDFIACRSEAQGLEKDIERVFGKNLVI